MFVVAETEAIISVLWPKSSHMLIQIRVLVYHKWICPAIETHCSKIILISIKGILVLAIVSPKYFLGPQFWPQCRIQPTTLQVGTITSKRGLLPWISIIPPYLQQALSFGAQFSTVLTLGSPTVGLLHYEVST